MIFVTVGTHEQSFNRLLQEVDRLKGAEIINEEVFIQKGYSTFSPEFSKFKKFLSASEMEEKINEARIIITHGGPATFLKVLSTGKKPIVVPRLEEFGEHINNHQLDFAHKVREKGYPIEVVKDIKTLSETITNHDDTLVDSKNFSNNDRFIKNFSRLINELV